MTLQGCPDLVDNRPDDPLDHPLALAKIWFENAGSVGVNEPFGVTLATVDANNVPSTRVLLMKDCDESGILSKKGRDMEHNPHVSANFWWRETVQQIVVNGVVERLSAEFSETIFDARSKSAKAIASISCQSEILQDEHALKQQVTEILQSDHPIRRPEHWYAYKLVPLHRILARISRSISSPTSVSRQRASRMDNSTPTTVSADHRQRRAGGIT